MSRTWNCRPHLRFGLQVHGSSSWDPCSSSVKCNFTSDFKSALLFPIYRYNKRMFEVVAFIGSCVSCHDIQEIQVVREDIELWGLIRDAPTPLIKYPAG